MTSGFRFRSASRTHRGSVRSSNQDAFFSSDEAALWAVCDGMGGHPCGDKASALVADRLSMLAGSLPVSKKTVRLALETANGELRDLNAENQLEPGMGTTVACLGIEDSNFFCLWVGDSRIYRLRNDRIELLTRDHRYVQELVDAGALDSNAARIHPQRNVLTRAVGLEPKLAIDECEGDVAANDLFILATDGITDTASDDEIAGHAAAADPVEAASRIEKLCIERGAPDNLTLILVRAVAR